MNHIFQRLLVIVMIALSIAVTPALAQQTDKPAPGMVRLNFPENVQLKVLADYVSERRGINFMYDKQLAGRMITIKAPAAIPVDSLEALLASALRMNGLTLSKTQVPNTMRIEIGKQLAAIAIGPDEANDNAKPNQAISRVFVLKNAKATELQTAVTNFLSVPTASAVAIKAHNILIVTDFAENMGRIERLIKLADQPGPKVQTQFVKLEQLTASEASKQIDQLLKGVAKARGDGPGAAVNVVVVPEERTNQLIVIGPTEDLTVALTMIRSLDVSLGLVTQTYVFEVVSPDRIDKLVREVLGEARAKRLYQSVTDLDANLLIATTTPAIHKQIIQLKTSLDRPRPEAQSPIRFYKLQNAKATDVLTTLRNIEGDAGLGKVSIDGVSADRASSDIYRDISGPSADQVNRSTTAGDRTDRAAGAALDLSNDDIGLGKARVLADEASNTIIVVGRPEMQTLYEKLIRRLDVRRPQVLIEATVVSIDTTDGFSLGVEILRQGDVNDKGRYLTFSSFGLSDTVDPSAAGLTLKPGLGFNGVVISADIADIVIRALQSDSRAKVVSRPSVLVNDNATGKLVSETEEPFSSVNASATVSTTSFGGFAAAGTSISVTPQISEGDYLKLDYEITLSSFAEASEDTATTDGDLPPARQTNSLTSEATIPDAHTIVIGGLTRENFRESIDRLPILGEIPGLEYLFSNRSKTERQTTLFVFVRAVILRDDKFQYLRHVSDRQVAKAELTDQFPTSEPIVMP